MRRSADRALAHCDCFNVPNDEEEQALEQRCRGAKIIVQPYGLNDAERAALAQAAQPAAARLARKEVCFLGMWSVRKGSRDWPGIIRSIWNAIPNAVFAFFGTIMNEETVLRDLELSPRESVRCIASYDPDHLPQLIRNCTVGLFPSYIEGFGLSVIEQLAAGIPTIAYDVPGPRHIFAGASSAQFLVPVGDTNAMVARATEILRMNESDYAALSANCRQIAEQFRWEQIAANTAQDYRETLEREHK